MNNDDEYYERIVDLILKKPNAREEFNRKTRNLKKNVQKTLSSLADATKDKRSDDELKIDKLKKKVDKDGPESILSKIKRIEKKPKSSKLQSDSSSVSSDKKPISSNEDNKSKLTKELSSSLEHRGTSDNLNTPNKSPLDAPGNIKYLNRKGSKNIDFARRTLFDKLKQK